MRRPTTDTMPGGKVVDRCCPAQLLRTTGQFDGIGSGGAWPVQERISVRLRDQVEHLVTGVRQVVRQRHRVQVAALVSPPIGLGACLPQQLVHVHQDPGGVGCHVAHVVDLLRLCRSGRRPVHGYVAGDGVDPGTAPSGEERPEGPACGQVLRLVGVDVQAAVHAP